ncbi:MAG: transcriptional regulator [Thermoplasmata archaeon]
MKPPCEIIVNKVLPSIRAAIVKTLINDYTMKQTEVAELLGITQGAVSLYYSTTRGGDEKLVEMFPEIQSYAKDIAKKIFNSKSGGGELEVCNACKKIRSKKEFCDYHKQIIQLEQCEVCFK